MFTADNIYPDINVNELSNFVSDYDIFKKYVSNFEEINKPFVSDLYKDNNASCRIYYNKANKLQYKDFGALDHHFSCYRYVMYKYNCTFKEALVIIANDFGLFRSKYRADNIILSEERVKQVVKPVKKSFITIDPRSWNLYDYNYWYKQYGIDFRMLDEYNVIPCKHAYLHKGDNTIVISHNNSNPIYAYRFEGEGKYTYKIYKPLSTDKRWKWLFSGSATDIEGYDNLELTADILIITKSLKDVMCCRLAGYNAISLQGEANKLDKELVEKLKKRFDKFIVFYDNDQQGIKSAHKISSNYGFKSIVIPPEYNCKDLSEIIALKGLKEAKIVLNKLINDE